MGISILNSLTLADTVELEPLGAPFCSGFHGNAALYISCLSPVKSGFSLTHFSHCRREQRGIS